MKIIFSLCLFLVTSLSYGASKLETDLDVFFNKYVKQIKSEAFDTRVDYKLIRKDLKRDAETRILYDGILKEIAEYDKTDKTNDELISFYINSYNFLTIHMILENLYRFGIRLPSILLIDVTGGPWKSQKFTVAKEITNLDYIEQGILRSDLLNYEDGRIHFVLNCASKGCPTLMNVSYKAETLKLQMDNATKNGMKLKRVFRNKNGVTKITPLFKWYAIDFENERGSVEAFIRHYSEGEIEYNKEVKFQGYNWFLNIYRKHMGI